MKLNQFFKWGIWKTGVCFSIVISYFVYLPVAIAGPASGNVEQSSGVVWSADHETGDLSQWSKGTSKVSEQDSGSCSRPSKGVSTEVARSGKYSMKMTIDSSKEGSGCRQFRYPEILSGKPYYYSAWLYFPKNWDVNGYTNIFQFKSKPLDGSRQSDPLWVIRTGNRNNGNMYYVLSWKGGTYNLAGPQAGNGKQSKVYSQSLMDIPVGKWTHLEVYFRQSAQFDGQITVWQDGVQIFDVNNIRTKFSNADNRWSVNNYGYDISPKIIDLYVDDAVISTTRVGPGASPEEPSPTADVTEPPSPTAAPTQSPTPAPTDLPSPTATPTQPPMEGSSIKINFLPSGAQAAPGYLSDTGQKFGDRGNGYQYGWNKNNTDNARDRNSNLSANQAYDTYNFLGKGDKFSWNIALPNGTYQVRIVAGDANSFKKHYYSIAVEGKVVVKGAPTKANRWVEGTATVNVTDGKLTITNASGAKRNKICFIEISTP